MPNNIIDKIQLSGVTYTIGGGGGGTGGTAVEEMTQAQYDAAASAGTLDAETLYIITDAEEINANDYVTKAQNNFSGYTEIKSMEGSYNYLYTNRTDIRTVYLSGTSSNNDGYLVLCLPNSSCEEYIGGFNFDSTVPTNTYCDITYDSTNKIYTISLKGTYPTEYINYFYFYEINNGRIWFVDTSVSSGQSAAVLNEFVPNVYNEIDKKPGKSDTVKTDSLSVSQSNSTQWHLYYIDNAENGHSTSFEVCDGEGIVMADTSTKLSLREISTVNTYTKEWITNECRYNICGNNNTTYNDAVSSITATFNSSLAEYNQFYFVVYYNSQGNINSLEWYITKKEGTIYINGAYLSDETSDFSTLNSEISANTGLNIEFSQSGLTYTKGPSNDPFICELYCNSCLQPNNSYSLFSSVITTQNKFGMYDAVNTLFGNYEDGKYVETSAITTAVTSSSTDNEIPTAKAVYDAIPTGGTGGGKAIEAGRGITVTTGATADTVSFNLPFYSNSDSDIICGDESSHVFSGKHYNNFITGDGHFIKGASFAYGNVSRNSFFGMDNTIQNTRNMTPLSYSTVFGRTNYILNASYAFASGNGNQVNNDYEFVSGRYNVSNTGSTDADRTIFSVGNGTADNARHNAFEVRQNGDIYITSGATDIKLQDHLGGGGGSITIDPTLDSGSTNAVANSAITNGFDTYTCQKNSDNGEVRYFYFPTPSNPWGGTTVIKNFSINGRCPLTQTNGSNSYIDKFSLVETSAITTAVTSSSTDAEVPSAKCLYNAIGDIETLLSQI